MTPEFQKSKALFCLKLALEYQRAMDNLPHRVDSVMRKRCVEWFSQAQELGVVLQ
jgi:hypothetical protein